MIRKKSGLPSRSDLEDPLNLHSYALISRALVDSKCYPDCMKLDEPTLSQVIFEIQMFMDLNLGISSDISKRATTKIPFKMFKDLTVGGSVMTILSLSLSLQIAQNWEIFDISSPERRSHGITLIQDIEVTLLEVCRNIYCD